MRPVQAATGHPERDEAAGRARRALGAGGLLALAGLAVVGVGPSDGGMALTLIGLVVTVFGIHTFGRLGPDEGDSGAFREGSARGSKRRGEGAARGPKRRGEGAASAPKRRGA